MTPTLKTPERYQITRRLDGLDTAHRLMGHAGKCRRLHGHRYEVDVVCSAPVLDAVGVVVDFSLVKSRVGGWCTDMLDHGVVLQVGDPLIAALVAADGCVAPGVFRDAPMEADKTLHTNDSKLLVVEFPPSAENLARFLHEKARTLLSDVPDLTVEQVVVWETPNCAAAWPQRASLHSGAPRVSDLDLDAVRRAWGAAR